MTDAERLEAAFLWSPTQAEVDEAVRRAAEAQRTGREAAILKGWRATHPEATCRDAIALILAELESVFTRAA